MGKGQKGKGRQTNNSQSTENFDAPEDPYEGPSGTSHDQDEFTTPRNQSPDPSHSNFHAPDHPLIHQLQIRTHLTTPNPINLERR